MVSLDYQPSNPLRGQGTVGIAPFRYQASDEHRVRPRQVETNPSAKTDLFLSQEIGVFFSDALRHGTQPVGVHNERFERPHRVRRHHAFLPRLERAERTDRLNWTADYTVQSASVLSSPGTVPRFRRGRTCSPRTGS